MDRIPRAFLCAALACSPAIVLVPLAQSWPQEAVSQDILKIQDFERRIAGYMKLRREAVAQVPTLRPTVSPGAISEHELLLAERIRVARGEAKQGDIFTPEIGSEFRRLIGLAMQGSATARIEKSLKHAEPVALTLRVDDTYPAGVPLQSTPPTFLLNLPALPKELEYRIVGHDLVLRDAEANLIVDFMTDAIP
jgi:hypothetical protein